MVALMQSIDINANAACNFDNEEGEDLWTGIQ
jgi:hypothetical protein